MTMTLKENLRGPLRAFIALAIGLLAYELIHVQYNYWILLSVTVLLPTTTGATIQKALSRVSGTLIGVLIGLLIVVVMPKSTVNYAVIIIISLFAVVYLSKSYYAIAMLFAGIMIVVALTFFVAHGNMQQAWEFVLARFFDTLLAAVIVIVTAYLFWPDRTSVNIRKTVFTLEMEVHEILHIILQQTITENGFAIAQVALSSMYTNIGKLQTLYHEAKREPNDDFARFYLIASTIKNFYLLHNNLIAISVCWSNARQLLAEMPEAQGILQDFLQTINKLKNGPITDVNDISNRYFVLASQIRKLQNDGMPIFTSEKYTSLAMLLLNLRSICVNLHFILMAMQQASE